jgi:hypothetical protein
MKTIGADDKIEPACRCAFKGHLHAIAGLCDAGYAVTEEGLASTLDLVIDQLGQITPRQTHIPAASERAKHINFETPDTPPAIIDEPKLADVVAYRPQGRE